MEFIFRRRKLAIEYATKLNKIASKHLEVQSMPAFQFFAAYCLNVRFYQFPGTFNLTAGFPHQWTHPWAYSIPVPKKPEDWYRSLVTEEAGLTSLRKTSLLFLASSLEVSASAVLVENWGWKSERSPSTMSNFLFHTLIILNKQTASQARGQRTWIQKERKGNPPTHTI